MEAPYGATPHGIWSDAAHLTIANLTLQDVYYHTIQFAPKADEPLVYHVKLIDSGEQFIKSSPSTYGQGVNRGRVAYSILAYTNGPSTADHGGGSGYTNGVDVHAGRDWIVENNIFYGFHTPDDSDNLWNPAVLFWNGASGTITRNNRFIDVDRAIAYGLTKRPSPPKADSKTHTPPHHLYADHAGGQIVNNMISLHPGLFSSHRRQNADASILVWNSPNTKVMHNTILNNSNHYYSIETRFNSSGVVIKNNLSDVTVHARRPETAPLIQFNLYRAYPTLFVAANIGDLHLKPTANIRYETAPLLPEVLEDFDGDLRTGKTATPGADELR
ncbi:MAG: hypothetical protein P8144_04595 [Gammaproteobacteria bacterium]